MVSCDIVDNKIIKNVKFNLRNVKMGRKKAHRVQGNLTPAEEKEFSRLYQEYRLFLLRYVNAVVKDGSLAEDIVQETFCEALRQFEEFHDHPNQKGWLIKAAYFKMREMSRKMHEGELVLLEEASLQAVKNDIGYEMKELDAVMEGAFDEVEREYFLKYYLRGYSVKELADMEGVTENNMRVRLHRLKEKLSHMMNLVLLLCLTVNCVLIKWIGK